VLIKGRLSDTATSADALTNTATVVTPTPNAGGEANITTASTADSPNGDPTVTDTANLTCDNSADKSSYMPGEQITYAITVANQGPAAAKAPEVTDALPPGVTDRQYSIDGDGTGWRSWTGSTVLPDIPAGGSTVLRIRGRVDSAGGSLSSTAVVTTTTPRTDGAVVPVVAAIANNPAVISTANLSIAKISDKTAYLPGETVTYIITVANSGPGAARAPTVADSVPQSVLDPRYSLNNGASYDNPWTGGVSLPDIPAGGLVTLLIRGRAGGRPGSLSNIAIAATPTLRPDGNTAPASAVTPGSPAIINTAELSVTNTANKIEYDLGNEITYAIAIVNEGPGNAMEPTLRGLLPDGVADQRYSLDGGATGWQPWTGSVTLPSISAGVMLTVSIKGTVALGYSGALGCTVTVATATPAPDGTVSPVTVATGNSPKIRPYADLAITNDVNVMEIHSNDPVVYTLTVRNNGPDTAAAPVVTDNLHHMIPSTQYSADNGQSWGPWTGSLILGDIRSGATAIILLKAYMPVEGLEVITNLASVTSSTRDPNPSNNNAQSPSIKFLSTADIAVSNTPMNPDSVEPRAKLDYLVKVTNKGPASAKDVIYTFVADQLTDLYYQDDSGAYIRWPGMLNLGIMPSGAEKTIHMTGFIAIIPARPVVTTASVVSSNYTADPNISRYSCAANVTGLSTADLAVTASDGGAAPIPGGTFIYTVKVRNYGPASTSPYLVAAFRAGFAFMEISKVRYSTDGGESWQDYYLPAPDRIRIPMLGREDTATVLFEATVATRSLNPDLIDPIRSTFSVEYSDVFDPDLSNNIVTVLTPVGDSATIQATKTADKTAYLPGDGIVYTITVANQGPGVVRETAVNNLLPPSVLGPEYSLNNGADWAPWPSSNTVSLPDIEAHSAAKLIIRGTIAAGASGSLSGAATVTTSTPNPDGKIAPIPAVTPGDGPAVTLTADISATNTTDKTGYLPEEHVVYTITVANGGPGVALEPVVTDILPDHLLENQRYLIEGKTGWLLWEGSVTLPDIPPGTAVTLRIAGDLAKAAAGSLSNTATIIMATLRPDGTYAPVTATTQGDPAVIDTAELTVTVTADAVEFLTGDEVIYTVAVANKGPAAAVSPAIADTMPELLENRQYSADCGATWHSWNGTASLPSLAPGVTGAIYLRGVIKDDYAGSLENIAYVTTATPRPDGRVMPVSGYSSVPVTAVAVLSAEKTADKAAYLPGESITYTIGVANQGARAAESIAVTDSLPAIVENPRYLTEGAVSWRPWTGSAEMPDIPEGTAANLRLMGALSKTATGGLYNAAVLTTATLSKSGAFVPVPVATRNVPTLTDSAVLTVTKTADKAEALPGEDIVYTVTVANAGPSATQSPVTVSDAVPASLENAQYSADNGATWQTWAGGANLPELAANSSAAVLIRGNVSNTAVGSLVNTASATTDTPRPDGATGPAVSPESIVAVTPVSAIVAGVGADSLVPMPGGVVNFSCAVTNNGPAEATGMELSGMVLPPVLENLEYRAEDDTAWKPWPGATQLYDLMPGDTEFVLLRGRVAEDAPGPIALALKVSSASRQPFAGDNLSDVLISPVPTARLVTTVLADTNAPKPGEYVTYTVTVNNGGPAVATGARALNTPPAAFAIVEYSTGGGVWQLWPGSLLLGDIPSGSGTQFLLRGGVAQNATGLITNTVSATSGPINPAPDGGSSTAVVNIDSGGVKTAALELTLIVDKPGIKPGETLNYTAEVINKGPDVSESPTITAVITGLGGIEYSPDGGRAWLPWTGMVSLADMLYGGVARILIRGVVPADAIGFVTGTVTVTSPTLNPNASENTKTVTVPIAREGEEIADLALAMSADKSGIRPGSALGYTLDVTNNGPNTALTPELSADIDKLEQIEYSPDGGVWLPWPGRVALADIPYGGSVRILLRGNLPAGESGSVSSQAAVFSPTPDPDPSNNTASVQVPIVSDGRLADLVLTLSADKTGLKPGDTLVYTAKVTNDGPNFATAPVLSATIDNLYQIEYSMDSDAWLPWPGMVIFPGIINGGVRRVFIRGAVPADATGIVTCTATVSSLTPDPDISHNTDTVAVPIVKDNELADLALTLSADAASVRPGDNLGYAARVTNNGPDAAEAPVVSANIRGLEQIEYSLSGGVWLPWAGGITLAYIPNGGMTEVLIRGTVEADATGFVTNTVAVASPTPDPDLSNNTATVEVPVLRDSELADLALTLSADAASVKPGETLMYTAEVINRGPDTAENPIITATVTGLNAVEYSPDGGVWLPWPGTAALGDMPNGAIERLLLRGDVPGDATGVVACTATASSPTPDPDPSNNTAMVEVPVLRAGELADLALTLSADAVSVKPGETLIYAAEVTNRGPDTAENPIITAAITGLNAVEYSQSSGVWLPWTGTVTLGDMPNGGIERLLLRGTVPENAIGVVACTATVSSTTPDPDLSNNAATAEVPVVDTAALSAAKSSDKTAYIPGELIIYYIEINNAGPATANAPRVTDTPPAAILNPQYLIDASGADWQDWTGGETLPDIAPNGNATLRIRGIIADGADGSLANAAVVESATPRPDGAVNRITALTADSPGGDPHVAADAATLSVTKTADKAKALAGDPVRYEITVNNAGPGSARTPMVSDILPAAVENPEYSVDSGLTWSPWTGIVTLPDLARNATATALIRGTVELGATGIIVNIATVSTPTPRPDGSTHPVDSLPVEISLIPSSHLVTEFTLDNANPAPGDSVAIVVTVANNGPDSAQGVAIIERPYQALRGDTAANANVELTDAPAAAALLKMQYSVDGGAIWQPWNGAAYLPDLSDGDSAQLMLTGDVPADAADAIRIVLEATSASHQPIPGDNIVTVIINVAPVVDDETADLAVTASADTLRAWRCHPVTCEILLANNGPDAAVSPVITAETALLECVEYSLNLGMDWKPWAGSVAFSELPNGGELRVLLRGTVPACACGFVTVCVNASSPTQDPNPDNNSAEVKIPVVTDECCRRCGRICCRGTPCGCWRPFPERPCNSR
jgi:uncharacterized repeat protein (TIGR01451 family)